MHLRLTSIDAGGCRFALAITLKYVRIFKVQYLKVLYL